MTDKPIAGTRRSPDPFDDKEIAIIARAARAKTYALVAVGVMFAIAAAYASRDLINTLDYHRVVESVRTTPIRALLLAGLATLASYSTLIGYDLSALRYVGARVPIAVAALASFCAYALGNSTGLGPLTGRAVRYRFYGAEETESGCPALVAIGGEGVKTGGGHHLGGDYAALAARIAEGLAHRSRGVPVPTTSPD